MSRRKFLAGAGAAALSMAVPEVMAAPEQKNDNLSMNFELTPFQRESLAKELERLAPGARAEFTLSDPEDMIAGLSQNRVERGRYERGVTRPRRAGVGGFNSRRESSGKPEDMIMQVHVIVQLKDGTEKRGKGVGFYPPQPNTLDRMVRQALADAFEAR